MVAAVLFPAARLCDRATASAACGARGGGGALRHCGLLPPARRRRGSRAVSAAAAPPERSSSSSSVPLAAASGPQHGSSSDDDAKAALYRALEGVNRGIFGMTSAQRSEIHCLVELLESRNPTPEPTAALQDKVDGCWKLIYSTISILGKKRTTLGLRDFISLGDFLQIIDVKEEKAVNVIKFSARALKIFSGQLTIEASYSVTSKTRVDIKLENSTITPEQLMNLFQKNYDMLLAIFNPDGWLEITYVDESLRIGRDDKENIFVLERADSSEVCQTSNAYCNFLTRSVALLLRSFQLVITSSVQHKRLHNVLSKL